MKIFTVAGTRPELIRLSIIMRKLDKLVDHKLIYTNQNYDPNLSTQFFDELGIREADYTIKATSAHFLANAMVAFENILDTDRPDKVLILGDTNSGLLALSAAKYGIPVYHMEAGNRCYDERVPEELNRKLIDTIATYNLPYTENSKQNLLNEGYNKNFVFKTGNPILEVLENYAEQITSSDILNKLDLQTDNFVLVTAHRAENVDDTKVLLGIMGALNTISEKYTVVYPIHPRTKSLLDKTNYLPTSNVMLIEPLGLFDFVHLERKSKLVISDCLHPNTMLLLSDGRIDIIKNINIGDKLVSSNSSESVLAKKDSNVNNKYKIKTKYNEIVCSGKHRLMVESNGVGVEKAVADITKKDKLVSFCKVDLDIKNKQKLKKVSTTDYLKITDKGINIIKKASLGQSLKQFGSFKNNTLYSKKGVSKQRLTKVLDHLNIDKCFIALHTYTDCNIKHKRQVSITQPDFLTEELAELAGFLCGDGFVRNSKVSLYDEKVENLKHFNAIFKKVFNIRGKLKKDKRNKCVALNVYSKALYDFFMENFYTESQTTLTKLKDISDIVVTSPNYVVAAYIRGLFEAEGFVGDHHFAITMSDKNIIYKLKYLLLRFGIITNIYEFQPRRKKDKSVLYQLNIYEHTSRVLFKDKIGFISNYKINNTKKLFDKIEKCKFHRPVKREGNIFFDLIRSIDIIEDEYAYTDINVSKSNTFLANGILSHNSGTVQEECCIFNIPSITIRESTERQELIECGSTILAGTSYTNIMRVFNTIKDRTYYWTTPEDYLVDSVSDIVINILLGK